MKRTLSIKINPNSSFLLLLETCNKIFNHYVEWAFANKTYNKNKAHKALYATLRNQFPTIPAALLQTIRDTAMEAIKAQKFKYYPNKKPHSAIRYDKRTLTLRGNQLTIAGIGKRHKEILVVPQFFQNIFTTWNFKGGQLYYKKHQFYINLVFETTTPQITTNCKIIGIDRGLYNLAVTSEGKIYSNAKVRATQRKFLYNRKKLQAKGTYSAKRHLKKMSGREKRFNKEINHIITKQLCATNTTIFVLEDLKSIRNQRRGKKVNKWLSSWPFYQFEQQLQYKAEAIGKKVEFVNASYTSQKCSRCGNRSRHNRLKSKFVCSHCGYSNHADINAAINIKNNYILSATAEKMQTVEQGAVNHPIVSVLARALPETSLRASLVGS